MYRYIVIFVLPFILFSCSSENPVEPESSKIFGTWKISNWETVTFNSNQTFSDTTFGIFPDNPNKVVVDYVYEGTYSLENNLITYREIKLTYSKGISEGNMTAFSAPVLQREYELKENSLYLSEVLILSPKDHYSVTINSNWEAIFWAASYDRNANPQYNGGKVLATYNFIADSNICRYSLKYLFQNPFPDETAILTYTKDPVTIVYDYGFKPLVILKDNKMYWYFSQQQKYDKG